ncbi:unnamed protein product [Psylliodes chrysocephalus]|uniref:Uncharacterized protein n=1 Tax=Psylliodes chrysocephalus TaxID=3402493 RepID=A0A9P0G862_9CUCU|nr:unnamed protein product [Psylliodes chrysocephala]
MMLYCINNSTTLDEIRISFFEPHHGQSEGDSAHSAIGYAVKGAGDIFIPSQLTSIIRLARRKHPYNVEGMNPEKFLAFKELSKNLRILTIRKCDNSSDTVDWTKCALLGNGNLIFQIYVVKLNFQRYLEILNEHNNNISDGFLDDLTLNENRVIFFQYDGATPHNTRNVSELLNLYFRDTWIGTKEPLLVAATFAASLFEPKEDNLNNYDLEKHFNENDNITVTDIITTPIRLIFRIIWCLFTIPFRFLGNILDKLT